MSDRYSRKDAEAAFARLASALGKTWSDRSGMLWIGEAHKPIHPDQARLWRRVGDQTVAAVGAWTLDYNPVYGGFVIDVITNEGGGVTQPFGGQRHPAREFCAMVRFALDAMAHSRSHRAVR